MNDEAQAETPEQGWQNGERHAYWCQHKSHEKDGVPLRVFISAGDPIPSCPVTGHGRMKRQNNKPYFGKPVVDAERT